MSMPASHADCDSTLHYEDLAEHCGGGPYVLLLLLYFIVSLGLLHAAVLLNLA